MADLLPPSVTEKSLLRARERRYRFIAAPADVTHPVAEKGLFNRAGALLPKALYDWCRHQFCLVPEALITLAHFSVSSASNLPKSAAEPGSAAPPVSARRAFILGSAKAVLMA
jgi:hypothetical protein